MVDFKLGITCSAYGLPNTYKTHFLLENNSPKNAKVVSSISKLFKGLAFGTKRVTNIVSKFFKSSFN